MRLRDAIGEIVHQATSHRLGVGLTQHPGLKFDHRLEVRLRLLREVPLDGDSFGLHRHRRREGDQHQHTHRRSSHTPGVPLNELLRPVGRRRRTGQHRLVGQVTFFRSEKP